MTPPKIDPKMAVDLDAVKQQRIKDEVAKKQAEEAAAERARLAVEAAAQAWEKAMNKTFRGIMTRKERRRMFASRFTDHPDEQVTA